MGSTRGVQLALVATLSYFPKLEPMLELLGSGHNADLREGFSIPPLAAHDSAHDTGEE
jgi:hypothetical protein